MRVNSTRTKRLKKVGQRLQSTPIAPESVDAALVHFCATGELPDQQRLAYAVTRKALYIREQEAAPGEAARWLAEVYAARVRSGGRPGWRPEEPVRSRPLSLREALLNEAVHEAEEVRQPARSAIKALVAAGGDVTDPQLVDDDVPALGIGTVAQHVLAVIAGDDEQSQRGVPGSLLEQAREDERSWSPLSDSREACDEERAARIRHILAVADARAEGAGEVPMAMA